MDVNQRTSLAVIVTLAISAQGCAWPSWGGIWGRDKANSTAMNPSASMFQSPGGDSSNSFTSAYRKAKDSIGSALTIQPKVIPADDPTRISSDPGDVNAQVYRSAAQLLEARGHTEEAIEQYRRAIKTDKQDVASYIGLARLYDRQGKYGEAVKTYKRAQSIAPNNSLVWNDLGLCLAHKGDLPAAIEALRHAVQLDPEKNLYRNNLATVLVQAGSNDEAYRELVAIYEPAVAQYNLAFLLHGKGDNDGARRHLVQAMQHDPSFDSARQLLAAIDGVDQFASRTANRNGTKAGWDDALRDPPIAGLPTNGELPRIVTPAQPASHQSPMQGEFRSAPQPLPPVRR